MSFARKHNEYLTPPERPEDYETPVLEALKPHDTARWRWHRIHCCLTGKDADLDVCGTQGIEVVSADDTDVNIIVHAGANIVGRDVLLNVSRKVAQDDAAYEKRLARYMEEAQELVCSVPFCGEWDGDGWYLSYEQPLKVPLVFVDYEPNYADTATAIIAAANADLARSWEPEMAALHRQLDTAAGWRDVLGRKRRVLA